MVDFFYMVFTELWGKERESKMQNEAIWLQQDSIPRPARQTKGNQAP